MPLLSPAVLPILLLVGSNLFMRTLDYSIGELASETGVKVPTIRYYEGIGLLAAPPRTEGNQRRYDATALERLRFIAHGSSASRGL